MAPNRKFDLARSRVQSGTSGSEAAFDSALAGSSGPPSETADAPELCAAAAGRHVGKSSTEVLHGVLPIGSWIVKFRLKYRVVVLLPYSRAAEA